MFSLFKIRFVSENQETVIYPNNLLLYHPIVVNPRNRLKGVGKIPVDNPELSLIKLL